MIFKMFRFILDISPLAWHVILARKFKYSWYRWQTKQNWRNVFSNLGNFFFKGSFEAHLVGPIHYFHCCIAFEASTAFSKINYRTCNCLEYKLLTFFFFGALMTFCFNFLACPSLNFHFRQGRRILLRKLSFNVKWFVRNLDSPCCFL